MTFGLLFLACSLGAPGVVPESTPAVDLTKIDRTIAKEPAYRNKPKYCLLVFGPQTKDRVWLVLDGETLYVDRNADGDLTGAGARVKSDNKSAKSVFFSEVPLRLKSNDSYLLERVHVKKGKNVRIVCEVRGAAYRKTPGNKFVLRVNADNVQFADRPKDAPILRFGGPLTFKIGHGQSFVRGEKPTHFEVNVGTPGLGPNTFTSILFESGNPDAVAEIEFPNRQPQGKPIVVKVALRPPP